jgi:hypothetical protein
MNTKDLYRNHFLTTKKCRESRHFGTNPSKNPTPIISSQIESAKGLTRDYKELKLLIRDALELSAQKSFIMEESVTRQWGA